MSDSRKKRARPKKPYPILTEEEILNLTDDDRAKYQVQHSKKNGTPSPEERLPEK